MSLPTWLSLPNGVAKLFRGEEVPLLCHDARRCQEMPQVILGAFF